MEILFLTNKITCHAPDLVSRRVPMEQIPILLKDTDRKKIKERDWKCTRCTEIEIFNSASRKNWRMLLWKLVFLFYASGFQLLHTNMESLLFETYCFLEHSPWDFFEWKSRKEIEKILIQKGSAWVKGYQGTGCIIKDGEAYIITYQSFLPINISHKTPKHQELPFGEYTSFCLPVLQLAWHQRSSVCLLFLSCQ